MEEVKPFSEVRPPPAPASVPHTNCPVVESHSSLSEKVEQVETSPAPYMEASVVEPVTVSLEAEVEASTEFPVTDSELALVVDRLVVPVAERLPVVRFDVEAFDRLV